MSSRFLTTRRHVVQQLAAALSAIALPTHAAWHPTRVTGELDLSGTIEALITHRNSAVIIGEAYLTQFEDERSTENLMSKLRERLQANTQRIDEQALLCQIRVDFERGDIVNLHGWLLSKTEARLCALCTF